MSYTDISKGIRVNRQFYLNPFSLRKTPYLDAFSADSEKTALSSLNLNGNTTALQSLN